MLEVESLSSSLPAIDFSLVERWYKSAVESESLEMGDITVVFCTDEELLVVNKEHLNHDYYTDIITFDYTDSGIVSGDLFISLDRVVENAESFKVSFEEELFRVLIHGVLHLCGYKDKNPEDEKAIREKENFYLNKLKGFT